MGSVRTNAVTDAPDTEPEALPSPADSDPTLDESSFTPSKSGLLPKVTPPGLTDSHEVVPRDSRGLAPDEVIAAMRELYVEGETETALLLASIVRRED